VEVTPNPLRERATFAFALAEPSEVTLAVYDGRGREVARLVEGPLWAGSHAVVLDARGWPSGVYAFRFVAGARAEPGRFTLVR
jgi:hypothetical protein